jgi:hypothetical protein
MEDVVTAFVLHRVRPDTRFSHFPHGAHGLLLAGSEQPLAVALY